MCNVKYITGALELTTDVSSLYDLAIDTNIELQTSFQAIIN